MYKLYITKYVRAHSLHVYSLGLLMGDSVNVHAVAYCKQSVYSVRHPMRIGHVPWVPGRWK